MPDRSISEKGQQCKGRRERIIVAFITTAIGTMEKPIVIWESEYPRCFKQFDMPIPVDYYNEPKAWMAGEIGESVLTELNI